MQRDLPCLGRKESPVLFLKRFQKLQTGEVRAAERDRAIAITRAPREEPAKVKTGPMRVLPPDVPSRGDYQWEG